MFIIIYRKAEKGMSCDVPTVVCYVPTISAVPSAYPAVSGINKTKKQ